MDFFFGLDIIVVLNMQLVNGKDFITHRWAIFKNYLFGWLVYDILCIFPFDIFISIQNHRESTFTRLIPVYYYNDILKFLKVPRMYQKINVQTTFMDLIKIRTPLYRLIKFLVNVIYWINFMGCIWYFAAKSKNFDDTTWVHR